MPLARSFAELHTTLHQLERVLKHLLWATVQGQPPGREPHALVDQFERPATECVADAEEARDAAARGREVSGSRKTLAAARASLILCQDRVNRISARYCAELTDRERVAGLDRLVRQRADWSGWAAGVRDALRPFPGALHEVSQAVFRCWQDLTDSAALLVESEGRAPLIHTAHPAATGATSSGTGRIVSAAPPGTLRSGASGSARK